MRTRHWSAYLRMLPGGENDVSSALAATGLLYLLLSVVTYPTDHRAAESESVPVSTSSDASIHR